MPIFIPGITLFPSASSRNLYRLLPVFVIDIIPESLSPSSRNAYRLAPDYARIVTQRACIKSYSSGFPGGEEAFINAGAAALKRDLSHLGALFDARGHGVPGGMKEDQDRNLYITRGWDREQVLLWGSFYYIRKLYREGDFDTASSEIAKVREQYGLVVKPLRNWDQAEEATYFSSQSLKNMIATVDLRIHARALGNDPKSFGEIGKEFVGQRDALKPYFTFTGDPTPEILPLFCRSIGVS